MTQQEGPRRPRRTKVRISHQTMDALTSTSPDLGERIGNAIRNILDNPEDPSRARTTDKLREEDKEQLRQLVGSTVIASYNIREAMTLREEPPLVLDRCAFVFMRVGDRMIVLKEVDEEVLQRLDIPRRFALEDTRPTMDITFAGIEDQGGEGVLVRLRRGEEVIGLPAIGYVLMPGLVGKGK